MKSLCALAFCVGLMILASCENVKEAPKKQEPVLAIEFKGPGSMTGWGKTASLEATPKADCLELKGHGWDSKMFRTVELQPGDYLLSATGKGEKIYIKLVKELSKSSTLFILNISGDVWRGDSRFFTVDKPTKVFLIAHLEAPGEVKAMLREIKIEKAPPPPEEPDIPTAEELGRQHPSPEIVRGCTFHGGAEKNFSDLRSWNANVARSWIKLKPARYVDGVAEYDPGWEEQLTKVESDLEKARRHGLKFVLTVGGGVFQEHCQKGGWDNPKLAPTVATVWKGVAQRLLPYRDVIYGYDLYNEPLDWDQMPHSPRQWRDIAKGAIKAIREVDDKTWIVYEPGPAGFAGMKPLPDDRVIYSAHYYSPHQFTHQGVMNIKGTDLAHVMAQLGVRYTGAKEQLKKELGPLRQFQLKYHVPVLIGEFSVIRWAPKADAVQYLKDLTDVFEEYHWSWIYHAFREYQGWSLEHDDNYPVKDQHVLATTETERAKVIKAALARNLSTK